MERMHNSSSKQTEGNGGGELLLEGQGAPDSGCRDDTPFV